MVDEEPLIHRIGTWKSEPGEVRKAVAYALKDGYRHIDAALYANIALRQVQFY